MVQIAIFEYVAMCYGTIKVFRHLSMLRHFIKKIETLKKSGSSTRKHVETDVRKNHVLVKGFYT